MPLARLPTLSLCMHKRVVIFRFSWTFSGIVPKTSTQWRYKTLCGYHFTNEVTMKIWDMLSSKIRSTLKRVKANPLNHWIKLWKLYSLLCGYFGFGYVGAFSFLLRNSSDILNGKKELHPFWRNVEKHRSNGEIFKWWITLEMRWQQNLFNTWKWTEMVNYSWCRHGFVNGRWHISKENVWNTNALAALYGLSFWCHEFRYGWLVQILRIFTENLTEIKVTYWNFLKHIYSSEPIGLKKNLVISKHSS